MNYRDDTAIIDSLPLCSTADEDGPDDRFIEKRLTPAPAVVHRLRDKGHYRQQRAQSPFPNFLSCNACDSGFQIDLLTAFCRELLKMAFRGSEYLSESRVTLMFVRQSLGNQAGVEEKMGNHENDLVWRKLNTN
jgi:hypothetical protein